MSSGSTSATTAQSLIHGYGDEFLLLASSLAEALLQVDSRGEDLAPSQKDLLRILDGVTGLGAMIDQLLRAVPGAVPHLERRIAEMSGRAADGAEAAATAPNAPESTSPAPPQQKPSEPKPSGSESTDAPTADQDAGDLVAGPSPSSTSEADAEEVRARVADAYAHLIDIDRSDQSGAPGDDSDDAPVQFAPRSAAGLARALQSLAQDASPKRATTESAGKSAAEAESQPAGEAEGEAPEALPETMALKGSNETMPLASVFDFIERVRKTGTLRIDLEDEQLTFGFGGGWVLSCRSSSQEKGDRVGDLLGEVCDRRALEQLLGSSEAMSMVQIGELVVRAGLATEGQMLNVLEQQVSVRYARACSARTATYEFVEGPVQASDGRLRIAPMELSFRERR